MRPGACPPLRPRTLLSRDVSIPLGHHRFRPAEHLLVGICLCLAGCGPEGRANADRSNTVTILTYGDERAQNWGIAGQHLVFLPLVRDGEEGGLARSWGRDQPMTFVLPEIRFAVAHERFKGLRSPDRHEPTLGVLYGWIDEGR